MAATYELISTTTLGSATTTFTVSSIPQTFNSLHVIVSLRSTGAANTNDLFIRLNGDTGNNYKFFECGELNSANHYTYNLSATYLASSYRIPAANLASGWFGFGELIIPNYTTTETKAILLRNSTGVYVASGTSNNNNIQNASSYSGGSGVSSISFIAPSYTIDVNSSISLYGLKYS